MTKRRSAIMLGTHAALFVWVVVFFVGSPRTAEFTTGVISVVFVTTLAFDADLVLLRGIAAGRGYGRRETRALPRDLVLPVAVFLMLLGTLFIVGVFTAAPGPRWMVHG